MSINATIVFISAFAFLSAFASFIVCFFYVQSEKRKYQEMRRRDRRAFTNLKLETVDKFARLFEQERAAFADRLEKHQTEMNKKYEIVAKAVYELQGGDRARPASRANLQAHRRDKELRLIKKEGLTPIVG